MYIRREHDLLGDRDVPADAYYGVHTLRAVENFPITGTPISIYPDLIAALASIKQAAARANRELGLLDATRADAIVAACEEIRAGRLHERVRRRRDPGRRRHLDQHERQRGHRQPRARAARHAEGRVRSTCTRNDHVNLAQSTNDVYPTAVKLALRFRHRAAGRRDGGAARRVRGARPRSSRDVLKMGRTQLQDAVPMTLGQEFSTYAVMLGEDEQRLREAGAADPRDQPGRAPRSAPASTRTRTTRALVVRASARDHRHPARHRAEPGRGDAGLRRLRAALGRAQAGRGEAVQDLQRPAAAVVRTARRLRRDQPAADAGGLHRSCRARSTR